MVLEERIAHLLLDRHDANGQLVDMFFEKPGFKGLLLTYLAELYDEFRGERVT